MYINISVYHCSDKCHLYVYQYIIVYLYEYHCVFICKSVYHCSDKLYTSDITVYLYVNQYMCVLSLTTNR